MHPFVQKTKSEWCMNRKSLKCTYANGNTPQVLTPPPPYGPHVPNGGSRAVPTKFPAVFFLDSKIFQRAQLEIQPVELPIPSQVLELIGDFNNWRSIAAVFFETVHLWIPMVSKSRLYGHMLNPLVPRRTDVALLILCMRLATM